LDFFIDFSKNLYIYFLLLLYKILLFLANFDYPFLFIFPHFWFLSKIFQKIFHTFKVIILYFDIFHFYFQFLLRNFIGISVNILGSLESTKIIFFFCKVCFFIRILSITTFLICGILRYFENHILEIRSDQDKIVRRKWTKIPSLI